MRRLALLLTLLLYTAGSATAAACAGTSILGEIETEHPAIWEQSLADLEAVPNSTGLLWKIEAEGAAPSWLFGTMHVADPDLTTLRPAVAAALAQSDQLVLELDLADDSRAALATKMLARAQVPEGERFDHDFTEAEREQLGEMTAAMGMPYFVARKMKPWFLALALAVPPCVQVASLRGAPGVDEELERRAVAAGKDVVGLETIDEQLDSLATLENVIGPEELREAIAFGPEGIADVFATQLEAYQQERPQLFISLIENLPEYAESAGSYRSFQTTLIDERNLRMGERLAPFIERGGTFIGVGALHLPGDVGLVALLRERGYTVTKVP